jgi:hypothetical protein
MERLGGVRRLHVFAVRVVHEVERLGDDGVGEHEIAAVLQLPLNRRVAHGADAVRAGEKNRSLEKPGFLDPVHPGPVAVTVRIGRTGEDRIPVAARPGEDRRDAGADRSFAGDQLIQRADIGGAR